MIDMDTRLRAADGIGKTETEASEEVFQTLKRRGHPDAPPATVSDLPGGRQVDGEALGKRWWTCMGKCLLTPVEGDLPP